MNYKQFVCLNIMKICEISMYRVVCPNFGHPALTSSFTKYKFLQVKRSFATLMNELSVLKLFQFSNGDLLFSKHDYRLYKVRKPRMTKLGQGVGVRAHYHIRSAIFC